MNKKNTQRLLEAFPGLYADHDKPMTQTAMCWGFECRDGWFDLIWQLSEKIEAQARKEGLEPGSALWPRAVQVKEKFGGLRFYIDNGSEAIQDLIEAAETESLCTCEDCGLPG